MTTAYSVLKTVHAGSAVLSGVGLVVRYAWQRLRPQAVQRVSVRVAAHTVDTLLLASAVGLLVLAQLNPLQVPWLVNKLAAVMVYITAGAVALHGPAAFRPWSLAGAVLTLTYIIVVAITKNPLGPLALRLP